MLVTHPSLIVTNTGDSGPGSLRQAIMNADGSPGPADVITFNIPGTAPFTIGSLSSPLPALTTGPGDTLTIDGTSQTGYAGTPIVKIDGSGLGTSVIGLELAGSGIIVQGLAIDHFGTAGIQIDNGANNEAIESNYLGVDFNGSTAAGNVFGLIIDGSSNDTIGGTGGLGNVISASSYGIILDNTTIGVFSGNIIGLNAAGTAALGNAIAGISATGVSEITIGGATAAQGNTISGNGTTGVLLDAASSLNLLENNVIGTNSAETAAFANGTGVEIEGPGNTIGPGNVISGNGTGVLVDGPSATGDMITGSVIGLNGAMTAPLPNTSAGVAINAGAGGIILANSVISGNNVPIARGVSVNGATNVTILKDIIGLNGAGTIAFPNFTGVWITQSSGTILQGDTIAGNTTDGVNVVNGSSATSFVGNTIGAGAIGSTFVNGVNGIYLGTGSSLNTIGGPTAAARNVISGNRTNGVVISDLGTQSNVIEGNYIGVDPTGAIAVPNGTGILVSNQNSDTTIADNLVSGNTGVGVFIATGASDVDVVGNKIGTDATGTQAVPNGFQGVAIVNATANTIGGTTDGTANVISGNSSNGIVIFGGGASGNLIEGNLIGTDSTGTKALPNVFSGIYIGDGSGFVPPTFGSAHDNTIGGTTSGAANVISGNDQYGILINGGTIAANNLGAFNNLVLGNLIGLNAAGTAAIALGKGQTNNLFSGIGIENAAFDNTIGGTVAGSANVASGNSGNGVAIFSGAVWQPRRRQSPRHRRPRRPGGRQHPQRRRHPERRDRQHRRRHDPRRRQRHLRQLALRHPPQRRRHVAELRRRQLHRHRRDRYEGPWQCQPRRLDRHRLDRQHHRRNNDGHRQRHLRQHEGWAQNLRCRHHWKRRRR